MATGGGTAVVVGGAGLTTGASRAPGFNATPRPALAAMTANPPIAAAITRFADEGWVAAPRDCASPALPPSVVVGGAGGSSDSEIAGAVVIPESGAVDGGPAQGARRCRRS